MALMKYITPVTHFFSRNKHTAIVIIFILTVVTIIILTSAFTNNSTCSAPRTFESFTTSPPPSLKPANGEVIIALFYADWCPHCVEFKPIFDSVKNALEGTATDNNGLIVRLVAVDCVVFPAISAKYGVDGFPTVKVFHDNDSSTEYTGNRDAESLTNFIKNL